MFNLKVIQQSNMLNFQFQNQIFNYNYSQTTQNLLNQILLTNPIQPTTVKYTTKFSRIRTIITRFLKIY